MKAADPNELKQRYMTFFNQQNNMANACHDQLLQSCAKKLGIDATNVVDVVDSMREANNLLRDPGISVSIH